MSTDAAVVTSLKDAVHEARWDAVEKLIEENWSLLSSTDLPALLAALTALPPEVIERSPRWGPAIEYVKHMMRGEGAQYRDLSTTPQDADLVSDLAARTSELAGARVSSRFAAGADAATAARAVLDDAPRDARVAAAHSLPHLMLEWGRTQELANRPSAAQDEYKDAFDLGVSLGDAMISARAAARLAWLEAVAGRLVNADRWLERDSGQPASPTFATPRYLAISLIKNDRLRYDEARASLEGMPDVRDADAWAETLYVRAQLATVEQAPQLIEDIHSQISERPSRASESGSNSGLLAHSLVRLHLLLGRGRDALRSITRFPEDAATITARMIALLSLDEAQEVARLGTTIDADGSTPQRWRSIALVARAVAQHRLGDVDGSDITARRAAELIRMHQKYSSLTIAPADEVALLFGRYELPVADFAGTRSVQYTRIPVSSLSDKERTLLLALTEDATLDEIAAGLYISRNTAKTHLRNIYRKLGVTTRQQAVRIAREIAPESRGARVPSGIPSDGAASPTG